MNGKQAKYYRKQVKKKINKDLEDMARVISNEKLYWRIVYAFRIIFKYHPEPIKFETKIKEK
ncbi:MAG: hypothetical protein KGZ42_07370 [Melioribacter sp.]|nr:hypothetical protein [Melioribacter sp.]